MVTDFALIEDPEVRELLKLVHQRLSWRVLPAKELDCGLVFRRTKVGEYVLSSWCEPGASGRLRRLVVSAPSKRSSSGWKSVVVAKTPEDDAIFDDQDNPRGSAEFRNDIVLSAAVLSVPMSRVRDLRKLLDDAE